MKWIAVYEILISPVKAALTAVSPYRPLQYVEAGMTRKKGPIRRDWRVLSPGHKCQKGLTKSNLDDIR